MTLKSNKIVPVLQFAQQKGLAEEQVGAALDQLTELVETAATVRPPVTTVLTTIGTKSDGSPLIVAWDTCGDCKMHVSRCTNANGPVQPAYVTKWVEEYEAKHSPDAVARLSTAVRSPETGGESFPAEGVPDSGESKVASRGRRKSAAGVPLAKGAAPGCSVCFKAVSEENADKNDDGTWTCHECQEGGN